MKSVFSVTVRIWFSIVLLFWVLLYLSHRHDGLSLFPLLLLGSLIVSVPSGVLLGLVLWLGSAWCKTASALVLFIFSAAGLLCLSIFSWFGEGDDDTVRIAYTVSVSIISGIVLHINTIGALLKSYNEQ